MALFFLELIMSDKLISNVYEIRELSSSFYTNYPEHLYPEILRKKGRPYDVILFETNLDYYVCVPFRTYLNHNQGFHFYPKPLKNGENPGIDYSKMLIIKENNYIGPSSLINATQMVCFNKNVATIQQEIFEYLEGYIKNVTGINILHPSQFNRKYQFSTLKYFHAELGI